MGYYTMMITSFLYIFDIMIFRSRIGVASLLCSLCGGTQKKQLIRKMVDVRVPTSFPYFSFSFWVLQNPHTEHMQYYIPRLPDDNAHEKLVTVECYFKMEKKCYIIYRCKHFLESLDGEKICTVLLGKRMMQCFPQLDIFSHFDY